MYTSMRLYLYSAQRITETAEKTVAEKSVAEKIASINLPISKWRRGDCVKYSDKKRIDQNTAEYSNSAV